MSDMDTLRELLLNITGIGLTEPEGEEELVMYVHHDNVEGEIAFTFDDGFELVGVATRKRPE